MRHLLALFGLAFLAVACGGGGSDPAGTVERYMEAKVAGDREVIQSLLCAEMESVLEREATTFQSVTGVEIEGMACRRVGETAAVQCDGRIVAQYGTEATEFPLVTYRVVEEDGEWKWCGESN